jgi:O-methyltransferase
MNIDINKPLKLKDFQKIIGFPHNENIDEQFHSLNVGNIISIVYWTNFFKQIEHIEGDIVECGVGRGRSLIILSALNAILKKSKKPRKVFAYDSFAGFPSPTIEDTSSRNPKKGEWSKSPSGKYSYSPNFIKTVLKNAGIPIKNNLVIKKGFFSDTLPKHPDRPIAILHADGDFYSSTISILESLYDKVVKGGIIIFDDVYVGNKDFPGAKLAAKEFLGKNFSKMQTSMIGTSYIIKK